ncbi:MAG: hypothetical protein IPO24_18620 [Bacteroidetes bacterium]|nr:hypothetical protein [Bacteroidota bacterium]
MKTQAYLTFLCCICWFSNLHAQFIKEYYKAPQATSFHAIVPVNESLTSNLFIAGTYGKQIVVGEVEQDGDVVWMKKLIVESKRYLINAMIKDSDGNLILSGGNYVGIGDNGFAFLIKFNPVSKSIMWFQQTNENILFFDCAEMGVGGNYVIGGQDEDEGTGNGADHLTMIADRETGSLSVFTSKNINLNETVDALLFDDASNFLYTTGRYELDPGGAGKFRGCLDKIDSVGNVVWTKYYIKDNASTARFYPKDIIKDGDALLIIASGDDEGYDIVRNFYLLKVDLEGNIIWVNKYDIEGVPSDGILCSIRKHLSGYIITGSLYDETYTDIFIINTNFEGDINWAKSFPYRKKTETFSMQMSGSLTVIGDKIFHVGEKLMPDGSLRGVLLSTSVANADFNICSADINLTKYLYVEPYQGEYVLTNAFFIANV